jgi:hypothetical protein
MSDIVARSHIRATQIQITLLTVEAAQRRIEFYTVLFKVLREERNEKQREESDNNHRKHRNAHTRGHDVVLPHHVFDHVGRIADGGVEDSQDDNFMHEMLRSFGDFPGHAIRGPWSCSVCTLMNNGGRTCDACGNLR